MVGVFSLFVSCLLLSWKLISSEFATLHLVFADRRATARTTTFVEPCSIQTKKNVDREAEVPSTVRGASGCLEGAF